MWPDRGKSGYEISLFQHLRILSFLNSRFCFTGRFDIIQRPGDQLEIISLGKVQEFVGDILSTTEVHCQESLVLGLLSLLGTSQEGLLSHTETIPLGNPRA